MSISTAYPFFPGNNVAFKVARIIPRDIACRLALYIKLCAWSSSYGKSNEESLAFLRQYVKDWSDEHKGMTVTKKGWCKKTAPSMCFIAANGPNDASERRNCISFVLSCECILAFYKMSVWLDTVEKRKSWMKAQKITFDDTTFVPKGYGMPYPDIVTCASDSQFPLFATTGVPSWWISLAKPRSKGTMFTKSSRVPLQHLPEYIMYRVLVYYMRVMRNITPSASAAIYPNHVFSGLCDAILETSRYGKRPHEPTTRPFIFEEEEEEDHDGMIYSTAAIFKEPGHKKRKTRGCDVGDIEDLGNVFSTMNIIGTSIQTPPCIKKATLQFHNSPEVPGHNEIYWWTLSVSFWALHYRNDEEHNDPNSLLTRIYYLYRDFFAKGDHDLPETLETFLQETKDGRDVSRFVRDAIKSIEKGIDEGKMYGCASIKELGHCPFGTGVSKKECGMEISDSGNVLVSHPNRFILGRICEE